MALLPPMILGIAVDRLTAGQPLPVFLAVLYYLFLALTGVTESVREGLLTVFGQKITHALRSSLMAKYSACPRTSCPPRNRAPSSPALWARWTPWRTCSLPASSACWRMSARY